MKINILSYLFLLCFKDLIVLGDNLDRTLTKEKSYEFAIDHQNIFDIIVHSLYEDKDSFIRELISNSQDALSKALFIDGLKKKTAFVKIVVDKKKGRLIFIDNGIGMCRDELTKNLGTIAYSTSKLNNDVNSEIIGQFGVGFYSAFLVSDTVEVQSKCGDSDAEYVWKSNGNKDYTVNLAEEKDHFANEEISGTKVTLYLKPELITKYTNYQYIKSLAQKYHVFSQYPIYIVDYISNNEEIIKQLKPVWKTNDVSDQELTALYRNIFDENESPLFSFKLADPNNYYSGVVYIPKKTQNSLNGHI